MKFLEAVRAQRDALAAEHDALVEELDSLAPESARSISDEDAERANTIIARLSAIKADDDALAARETELAEVAERRTNARRAPVPGLLGKPEDVDAMRLSDGDARARAVSFVEQSRSFITDEHRNNLVNLIERNGRAGSAAARLALTTGSEVYQRAWSKYMSGQGMTLTDEERSALARGTDVSTDSERAMTSGTGSSGGYFVPVFIDPTMVITGAGSLNYMRQISTVKTIGPAFGGWYGATAAQVTAAWTAENNAAPDNTPTITQPNIPVYMAEAFVGVSFQAFEDISDLAGDVLGLFTDAKANLEAAAYVTGSGSSQPTGVVTAVAAVTASRVSPTTGGTFGIQDVFVLHRNVPARFRGPDRNRAFMANVYFIDEIRRLAMAQNSANSVFTDLSVQGPASLLGDPLYESSPMSSSVTTGQNVLITGDFSRFYIVDRVGFSTEFIPNLFDTSTGRPLAQRGWMSHWRTGANAVDTNAFRLLQL